MPGIIAHKGNSFAEVVNHQWITTEGVFALGVSTSVVFLFVLFGALLDRPGDRRGPDTMPESASLPPGRVIR